MNEKDGYQLSQRTQELIRRNLGIDIKVVTGGSEKDFGLFVAEQTKPREVIKETQNNDEK